MYSFFSFFSSNKPTLEKENKMETQKIISSYLVTCKVTKVESQVNFIRLLQRHAMQLETSTSTFLDSTTLSLYLIFANIFNFSPSCLQNKTIPLFLASQQVLPPRHSWVCVCLCN